MTSHFQIVGHMARGFGNNDVGSVLTMISTYSPGGATLFYVVVVYVGSKWYSGDEA